MGIDGRTLFRPAPVRVGVPDRRWPAWLADLLGKEEEAMIFTVKDASGHVLYYGDNWPMARAALDFAVHKDEECPRLDILPEGKE